MGDVLWTDPPTRTQIVTNAEPGNNAGILSDNVANESGPDLKRFMTFWLEVNYSIAPSGAFLCYILPSHDGGTTYEDGSASVQPEGRPDFVIAVRPVTTAQVLAKKNIPIPPSDFKVLVWNETGQTPTTNTLNAFERRFGETVA